MKILVLGASGMLGSAIFQVMSKNPRLEVWGTIRSKVDRKYLPGLESHLIADVDLLNTDDLIHIFEQVEPMVVINAVGIVKQLSDSNNPLSILPTNTLLPHRLAKLCKLMHARLIHISTDCVFNGRKGGYVEADNSDAEDLYGKSKFMGELHNLPHALTLRTSIIGHEPKTCHSLIDWFLAQQGSVKGFSKAIFSGLPAVELAQVIMDRVLPLPKMHGVYHVSASPISKLELLKLVALEYKKEIELIPDDELIIDRSLNSFHFSQTTDYTAPTWTALIHKMREFQLSLLVEKNV